MKTKWSIIKSASGRQNEHETSKYQYSPDSFNNFFINSQKINRNIKHSSGKNNNINNPKYYLSEILPWGMIPKSGFK